MTEVVTQARKVGGSLMIRIPKDIVALEGIHEGETVSVEVHKLRKDWFGAFPGLTSFNKKEDRMRSHFEDNT